MGNVKWPAVRHLLEHTHTRAFSPPTVGTISDNFAPRHQSGLTLSAPLARISPVARGQLSTVVERLSCAAERV